MRAVSADNQLRVWQSCTLLPPRLGHGDLLRRESSLLLGLVKGPALAVALELSPITEDPLFQLSLVDHIRLSFGSVATSYRAHARAAERLAARARRSRIVLAVLLGMATGSSLLALTGVRPFQIAAAALMATSLVGLTVVHSLEYEARAFAHRACAAQLWLLCEKYRALLAEVHDGLIDLPETTSRRDNLMREVQNVYEHALPADREAYQIAREALGAGTGTPSDQDIDQFLPASLRQTAGASPT